MAELYHQGTHSIVDQQKRKEFDESDWIDFLFLVKMGHYTIPDNEIINLISSFNSRAAGKVVSLEEINPLQGNYTDRFIKRLLTQ